MKNAEQQAKLETLEAALEAAVAANEALIEYERSTPGVIRVAFLGLSLQEYQHWKAGVEQVNAGTLTNHVG